MGKTLVAYFSASGVTAGLSKKLAEANHPFFVFKPPVSVVLFRL